MVLYSTKRGSATVVEKHNERERGDLNETGKEREGERALQRDDEYIFLFDLKLALCDTYEVLPALTWQHMQRQCQVCVCVRVCGCG